MYFTLLLLEMWHCIGIVYVENQYVLNVKAASQEK